MYPAFNAARPLAALLLCWSAGAQARDTGTDPSLVIEKFAQAYVVDADGAYTLTVDDIRSIAQEQAIASHSQYYISYNRTLDEVGQIAAYTEKPDGRRVGVGPEHIKDQQESVSADAPMFQDTRVKVVVFPQVEVGDRLVLHYVLRRASALFPGQFEDLSSSQFYLNNAFSLSYDLPAAMPLHADAAGFQPVAVASPPGRRRYQWQYVPGENIRIESDSVSYLDYGKRLAVSTFADYAAFARAFHTRAQDKARVTPAIAALARQLTEGLPDTRTKALALSDWVRKNIRYVGVYIGPGGVVPHAAASVLEQRYGDCKDHAGLLEALLAAVGIDSSGALINSDNVYRLPRAPTLGIFNHMITYIPSLDLYLDSTAETVAAGFLPNQDLGKPVLLIKSGRLAHTPSAQPERSKNALEFKVGKHGDTLFRVAKTNAGATAEPYRQAVRDIKPAERDRMVERILQGLGLKGYGVLDPGRLDGSGDEYQMVFAGVSENFANLPGPTGIATSFNFWGGLAETVAALAQEKERSQDFICPAIDSEDETGLDFAPEVRILALPAALSLHGAHVDYSADYLRKGNAVMVRRRLRFHPAGIICTAADFKLLRPLLDQMLRDLKNQIIIQAM
ncbi:transglutaminase-like putative cysteine protease [Oxalobacteraceae bacterium GrIS 1.11]